MKKIAIEEKKYRELLIRSMSSPPLPDSRVRDAIIFNGDQHNPSAIYKESFLKKLSTKDLEWLHEYGGPSLKLTKIIELMESING